jgi:hypothetical protein
LDFNKIGTKVGVLRKQWTYFKNMVEAEVDLHKLFAHERAKLVAQGRGGDLRFMMPDGLSYFDGQRAEAVWEGADAITISELESLARTAEQAQRFIMWKLLGWQRANYSR